MDLVALEGVEVEFGKLCQVVDILTNSKLRGFWAPYSI